MTAVAFWPRSTAPAIQHFYYGYRRRLVNAMHWCGLAWRYLACRDLVCRDLACRDLAWRGMLRCGGIWLCVYAAISDAEPLDLAQCQRIYHQHQATLQQLRQGYSIAQGRHLKQVQQMQIELLTHQCPFALEKLSQASMAALQAVQQRGIQRRQASTARAKDAAPAKHGSGSVKKRNNQRRQQQNLDTVQSSELTTKAAPSISSVNHQGVAIMHTARTKAKHSAKTKSAAARAQPTAPELFASHIGSQGRYQGIKWRYWQKFYQEPKRCYRQRDSQWLVYCSERRLLAQQMFDLLWPDLAQALQDAGEMTPNSHE